MMKNKKAKRCLCLLCCIFLLTAIICSCGNKKEEILCEEIWIENRDGTYTRAEAVIPHNYAYKQLPLISMSHGFKGNRNSAGGKYLAESLAKAGIATIRMDYSHYEEMDERSSQTNQYTVKTMEADQLSCIEYMIEHYHVDDQRIGLYGRSLGGRVVMTMANEHAGGFDYQAMTLVAPAGTKNAFIRYMGGEKIWKEKKSIAEKEGSVIHQNIHLTPEFFSSIEEYTPSEHGEKFGAPVLLIYNTEDDVVLPEASLECGRAYEENLRTIEVTSKKSPHGCEMGFKESEIKDRLINAITEFFKENL